MLTFIKLGGSLITDKRENQQYRPETMQRVALEIAVARAKNPNLRIVIGHGSGSFGHVAASKYGTAQGVSTRAQWDGFSEVAIVARRLNNLVSEALFEAGLPIFPVSPSASAQCSDGVLVTMDSSGVRTALNRGLIPVVYGDVAFDKMRGGTIISTETVFAYLAEVLTPNRIFLLGEVEGVYDSAGQIIPMITTTNFEHIVSALGGSHGTDVTGGMLSKVQAMVTLAQQIPGLNIHIFGGLLPGQLEGALSGIPPGTHITNN